MGLSIVPVPTSYIVESSGLSNRLATRTVWCLTRGFASLSSKPKQIDREGDCDIDGTRTNERYDKALQGPFLLYSSRSCARKATKANHRSHIHSAFCRSHQRSVQSTGLYRHARKANLALNYEDQNSRPLHLLSSSHQRHHLRAKEARSEIREKGSENDDDRYNLRHNKQGRRIIMLPYQANNSEQHWTSIDGENRTNTYFMQTLRSSSRKSREI